MYESLRINALYFCATRSPRTIESTSANNNEKQFNENRTNETVVK